MDTDYWLARVECAEGRVDVIVHFQRQYRAWSTAGCAIRSTSYWFQTPEEAVEKTLGIGERERETRQQVLDLLQERGQMSPALFSAYLLPVKDGTAIIATPVEVRYVKPS